MLKVGLNGFERSGAPGLRKIRRGGRIPLGARVRDAPVGRVPGVGARGGSK